MDNEITHFWTVLLSDFALTGGQLRVKGHFAFVSLEVVGGTKRLSMVWLTPEDRPFEFVLPKALYPKKRIEEISVKDIETRFIELLEEIPVSTIPEAPLPIPVEKLPPSKRRKVIYAAKKAREERIRGRQ